MKAVILWEASFVSSFLGLETFRRTLLKCQERLSKMALECCFTFYDFAEFLAFKYKNQESQNKEQRI